MIALGSLNALPLRPSISTIFCPEELLYARFRLQRPAYLKNTLI